MYTSYKVQKQKRRVPQCRADRMESAKRFRALLSELGLKMPHAAQNLRVSLRTLQNWTSGKHEVPYSALKLLRLQRYMELPFPWVGWHFSRGKLVTPEGRTIDANEGVWWSLLVSKSRSFTTLYHRIRVLEDAALQPGKARPCTSGNAASSVVLEPLAGPVILGECHTKSDSACALSASDIPAGNHGDNLTAHHIVKLGAV
jgi:transcriptional regulator with XRE-family HTH domain